MTRFSKSVYWVSREAINRASLTESDTNIDFTGEHRSAGGGAGGGGAGGGRDLPLHAGHAGEVGQAGGAQHHDQVASRTQPNDNFT